MISEKIPDKFIPQLEVVSCYIEYEGKLLLLQRHPHHRHGSKWGLPAGKIERGESIEQAIIREIREETGLVVGKKDLMYREVLFVSHEGKEFLYHVFHTRLTEGANITINPPEHQQFGWFSVSQVLTLNLIHDLDACVERHYVKSPLVMAPRR